MTEYTDIINEMFPKTTQGTLKSYFIEFLLTLTFASWWSQPQAISYCNKRVFEDGGVGWHRKGAGLGLGKKNPDGTPTIFGDPGRELENIRREKYDGCWDNQTLKSEGPFRLNVQKFKEYQGPTKGHTFTDQIKKSIHKRSEGKCELCGYKGKIEIDHFIPREKGGESNLENANALCSRCNDRKCSKEPQYFMKQEYDRMKKYFYDRGLKEEFDKLVNL